MRFNHLPLTPEEQSAFQKLRRWVIGVWSAIAIAALAAAFATVSDRSDGRSSRTASVGPADAALPAANTLPRSPLKTR